MDLEKLLARQPRSALMTASLMLVIILGILDYATGPHLGFSVFYLLPVSLAAWYAGRSAGVMMALVATATFLMVELRWQSEFSHFLVPYWNAAMHLCVFLLVSVLLSQLRQAYAGLEELVDERTVVLREEIAEHKRTEERLQLLAHSVEQMREFVVITDLEDKIVFVNQAFVDHYGYSLQELIGRPVTILLSEKTDRLMHGGMLEQNRTQSWQGELWNKAKDGREFPIYLSTSRIKDSNGNLLWLVGISEDITERKRVEDRIRLMSTALEASANATIITDSYGTIQWINPAWSALTGYAADEAIGQNPRILKSGNQDPSFYRALWETILSGRVWHGELVNRRKDGSLYIEEETITPLVGANGEITHFIGVKQDISERKRLEQEVQTASSQLKTLFDKLDDVFWSFDVVNKATLQMSPACEKLYGYSPEEFFKNPMLWYERIYPDDRPVVDEKNPEIYSGQSVHVEHRIVRADGEIRWVEAKVKPTADETGKVVRIDGVVSDITDRKQAEKDLKLFRALIDRSNDAIKVIDPETGRFLDVNEKACVDLGYTREEILSLTVPDIDPTVDPSVFRENVERLKKSASMVLEGTHRRKDGTTFPVEIALKYVQLDRGYLVSVARDVTERHKIEQALRESEKNYKDIVDNSLVGVYQTSLEGKILFVNKSLVSLFEFDSLDEMTSTDVLGLYKHPAERIRMLDALKKEGKVDNFELEVITKKGNTKRVLISARLAGNVTSGVIRDITKMRELEQELLQSQKLDALGRLTGGIAHDFNNILAIILAHAGLAKRVQHKPSELLSSLDTVSRTVQRGASLVRQLMTFARKADQQMVSLSLNDAIEETVKLVRETIPRTIVISTQLQKDLPKIVADSTHVSQVILNLCVNARDAMPNGGTLTVRTRLASSTAVQAKSHLSAGSQYVVVDVEDNGVGMDEQTRLRIFEPFFTTKELGKGTGLGLSVVFGIMEGHNGFVDVESEEGKGTVFHLYFPVKQLTSEQPQTMSDAIHDVPGGKETILLVEDEVMLRELVTALVEEKGYTVLAAKDGQEAVEIYEARAGEIALVVCDFGLPKLNGLDVFKRMKQVNPSVKFISASGYMEPGQKVDLLEAGAKDFVQKPYEPTALLKMIREMLDGKSPTT